MNRHFIASLAALGVVDPAISHARQPDPSGYIARLEQVALLNELDARLLAGSSATRALETWCLEHRLAPHARIIAERITGADKPISAEQRVRLEIGPDEPVRYRRVHLKCGDAVLSEADNWYVPARLTAEMNAALDSSDAPFGKVVASLGINRRTIGTKRLWNPMDGRYWDVRDRSGNIVAFAKPPAPIPDFIIEHRAIVLDRNAKPISEVIETYTKWNIAAPTQDR